MVAPGGRVIAHQLEVRSTFRPHPGAAHTASVDLFTAQRHGQAHGPAPRTDRPAGTHSDSNKAQTAGNSRLSPAPPQGTDTATNIRDTAEKLRQIKVPWSAHA